MRSLARLRFANKVNAVSSLQTGIMHTVSANGHSVKNKMLKEENAEPEEIKAGITIVGSHSRVIGKKQA